MGRLAAWTGCFVLSFAALAAPQDKPQATLLQAQHKVGESFTFRYTLKAEMDASGKTLTHRDTKQYKETVVEVKDGAIQKAERVYSVYESADGQSVAKGVAPSMTKKKKPLAGLKLTLESKDGEVVANGEGSTLLVHDDLYLRSMPEALLPGKAVAVGTSWDLPVDSLKRVLPDFDADAKQAHGKCTLDRIEKKDGKDLAVVSVEFAWSDTGGQGSGSVKLSGPLLFDVAAARVVSLKLKGPLVTPMGKGTFEIQVASAPVPAK